MESDPNRQWFVYFQEKEQGPFSEAELRQRISTKEFSSEAYVFTEGMADWALVKETPVLSEEPAKASELKSSNESKSTERTPSSEVASEVSSSEGDAVKRAAEETLIERQQETLAKTKKKSSRGFSRLLLFVVSVVCLVVIAGVALSLLKPELASTLLSSVGLKRPESQITEPMATVDGENLDAQNVSTASKTDKESWSSLLEFRSKGNSMGSGIMLSSPTYSRELPILRGAVSPRVSAKTIHVAIFPDVERSLMAVPVLWTLDVPLLNGLFAIGPLNIDGAKELPPGRWTFLAAHDGILLGEAHFETGIWPGHKELLRYREAMQQEAYAFAKKELEGLKARVSELNAATEELKENSKLAEGMSKTRKAWLLFSDAWFVKLGRAIEDQKMLVSGPMFFPVQQTELLGVLSSLDQVKADLDALSSGGPKKLLSSRSKNVKEIWPSYTGAMKKLEDQVSALKADTDAAPLTIDREVVKMQLLEKK